MLTIYVTSIILINFKQNCVKRNIFVCVILPKEKMCLPSKEKKQIICLDHSNKNCFKRNIILFE